VSIGLFVWCRVGRKILLHILACWPGTTVAKYLKFVLQIQLIKVIPLESTSFYPRNAMLARVLAMALCLSVCLSQVGVLSKRLNESSWFFGMWASLHPSYTVLKGNSVISKTKRTSLWNFVLNSRLITFCYDISIVETCYQLSSRKVDAQSMINWTVVGQLSR